MWVMKRVERQRYPRWRAAQHEHPGRGASKGRPGGSGTPAGCGFSRARYRGCLPRLRDQPPATLWHPFRMPGAGESYSTENSEEPFREFDVFVSEGHSTIAQRFNAGSRGWILSRVPEGRQKPDPEIQVSIVPPGLASLPASTQR